MENILYFSHWSIDGEGNDEDASEHVHDGDGEEEEVVGSVEVVTLLDDHAEGEVAEEADDDDDQVQDDVAPAAIFRSLGWCHSRKQRTFGAICVDFGSWE